MSQTQHPNPALRWKNRRMHALMASITLCSAVLLLPILAVFEPQAVQALGAVSGMLGPALLALGGVVGAYMGFATQEDIKMNQQPTLEEIERGP